MKKFVVATSVLTLVFVLAIWQRHRLLFFAVGDGHPPALLDAADEGPETTWHDDYFTVEALDSNTYAIGEPRYYQQNYSYLIIGRERAILFDAGPGYRDIRAVAESLTDVPITFVPSHFHYDHVGNTVTFDHVAVVDLPYLRVRAKENRLALTWSEHLGSAEGVAEPTLIVDEWLAPGSSMQLGDRELLVLYTPGHTEDSISLLDTADGSLFTGDFIYPGELYGFLPNSGMGDYLRGADTILAATPADATLYGAHRVQPPGPPRLGLTDVRALRALLLSMKAGSASSEGFYPRIYTVNDRVQLLAEPPWLQRWVPRR